MPIDYEKKIEWIKDFYCQSTTLLEVVNGYIKFSESNDGINLLTNEFSKPQQGLILFNPSDELENRKRQLLIELGRIGEYSLKYIILLEQLNQFPNQTFEEFKDKALFMLNKRGIANTYKHQYHLDETKIDLISSFHDDNNQPLHNYHYLFKILESFYPYDVRNLHMLMILRIKSNLISDSDIPSWIKPEFLCFPQKKYINVNDLSQEKKELYEAEFNRIIRESGDVFTSLRYFENNFDGKEYDFNDIYNLICYIVEFIQLIHSNNNVLHDDITVLFNKQSCLSYIFKKIQLKSISEENIENSIIEWKLESERINNLFSIPRLTNNPNLMVITIFKSNLSFEEIEKITNIGFYDDDDLYAIFANNIDFSVLNQFFKREITNVTTIISIFNKSKTDEKIKEAIQNFDKIDNAHFLLLNWLNFDLLEKIHTNDGLDEYLTNNMYVLEMILGGFPTLDDYNLFEKIISLEEVQDKPYILEGLDYQQKRIYSSFTNSQISENEIIDNIKSNFKLFEKTPLLLKKLPLMLDSSNNKKIVDLLTTSGLDLSKFDNLDGTIFCIPYDIVCSVNNYLISKNIPLVVNNNCNLEFYKCLEIIIQKQEHKDKKPLPIRHKMQYFNNNNNNEFKQKKSRA